ncbi:arylsulfatase B-like [Ixodes scapularis]|uniref:arylsulfatase B-like n=1 Tax=Ixodes scapularis TaxID=6945 RepID=UPI001C38AAE5|nr:arylsulfatase B-like [Ixodes scapularis]
MTGLCVELIGFHLNARMITFFLLALAGVSAGENAEKKKPPHIVFILADDLGWDDTSIHGSSQIPTPNMDAMAADGIILNQHYVQPLCTPSRAALMTGRYPFHIGMQHAVIIPAEPMALPLEYTLMPEHFRRLGYKTHMVGKWHLGYYDKKYVPLRRGFDTFFGFYNPSLDYFNQNFTEATHTGHDFRSGEEIYREKNPQYSTYYCTNKTIELIRRHKKSTPLFLFLSHQAPHVSGGSTPFQVPSDGVRNFTYIKEENRTLFAGMVDALDQSVGRVVAALQEENLLNDTILVFSSDNGALPWGFQSNRGYNWPLRGGKSTLYEGGVRGTAFLWSRRLKNTKRVSNQLMHISDWLPTLYSAAGGNVSELGDIDGVDMWESLSTSNKSQRGRVVLNIDSVLNYSAIRVGDYKLIEGRFNKSLYDQRFETVGGKRPLDDLDALMNESVAASALRDLYKPEPLQFSPYWRAEAKINCSNETSNVDIHQDAFYLFNIKEDPCETNNLVREATEAGKLNELKEILARFKEEEANPLNKRMDPAAFPECHNGVWDHWVPTVK